MRKKRPISLFTDIQPDKEKNPPIQSVTPITVTPIKIKRTEILGRGSSSVVFSSDVTSPNGQIKKCAAKQSPNANEVRAHQILNAKSDPNTPASCGVSPLLDIVIQDDVKYAIFPRCSGMLKQLLGDLYAMKHDPHDDKFFAHIIFHIFDSLVRSIDTLQQAELVHGDINFDNIGLRLTEDGKWNIELTDLGIAKQFDHFAKGHHYFQGTLLSMPPEIARANFEEKTHPEIKLESSLTVSDIGNANCVIAQPEAIDIYSLGCVMHYLLLIANDENNQELLSFGLNQLVQLINAFEEKNNAAKISFEERIKHQLNWRKQFESESGFDTRVIKLIDAMREILPEDRPTMGTLKWSIKLLRTSLPILTEDEKAQLSQCYLKLFQHKYLADRVAKNEEEEYAALGFSSVPVGFFASRKTDNPSSASSGQLINFLPCGV